MIEIAAATSTELEPLSEVCAFGVDESLGRPQKARQGVVETKARGDPLGDGVQLLVEPWEIGARGRLSPQL